MGHIRRLYPILRVALAGMLSAPMAGAADFHQLFEERCLNCHGHSGPFVSQTLQIDEGRIVGRSGQPVTEFLQTHAGGLDDDTLALFLRNFRHQIESGSLFRTKCMTCHDRAYEFTRLNLSLKDGTLVGRYTGRNIADFLRTHGRLTPEEQTTMLETLRGFLTQTP